MKSIVITGVAGLLGSRLADWLIEHKTEYKVIGIDNLMGGYLSNVNPKVDFHQLDLATDDLESIFSENEIEYVYHFAAYAAEGLSPFIRKFNYQNNLIATANIINNCIKYNVGRLVFTSSMATYGVGNPPFDEDDQPAPIDPYGIAKYACEMDIKVAGEQHGLDWCIIRPHNVYGINQNIWDRYRNVLGIWMYQKLNNEPFSLFGTGEQKRAFSYIDDILQPLWIAASSTETSKQIINLGGTKEYSLKEAAETLAEVVGGHSIKHFEARHEVKFAFATYKKSQDLLNYSDHIPLKDGLSRMWDWAQKQPHRDRFTWEKYELDEGMYSFWKK
ncbi:NAD-dependent epimerase/dehydratase family protein [Echinicola marina]|uniref:NAD-dependent epimerase/dehydratase family protein n=1 Tax=Echinicola marina TaxID=2859768 RepID=UPI001CF6A685|nr:NAD-dependent epimerase/dehydratase family protein [Echinicola marina]UCS94382.1 NAD-dependent epimerase/dehydratase family protein [Echinicola marina]